MTGLRRYAAALRRRRPPKCPICGDPDVRGHAVLEHTDEEWRQHFAAADQGGNDA